jgi:hypothetical protein
VWFRDDQDRKLAGIGVIERVIRPGPEPVFEADGHRNHVTSATEPRIDGGPRSVDGVAVGDWVRDEGRSDKSGDLIASQAEFLAAKAAKVKALKGIEENSSHFEAPRQWPESGTAQKSGGQAWGDA